MATTLSKIAHQRDRALDVSISINESILKAIDAIRGDTNRSLWLRRLAIKELQRLKQEKKEENENGLLGVEVRASHQAANHNHEKCFSTGGFNGK